MQHRSNILGIRTDRLCACCRVLSQVYQNTANPYDEGCFKNCYNFMFKAPRGSAIVAAHGEDAMNRIRLIPAKQKMGGGNDDTLA